MEIDAGIKKTWRGGPRAIPFDYTPYTAAEIRAIRNRENMSQYSFCRALGVDHITVMLWEKGKVTPANSALHLLRLFDMYPELFIAQSGRSYFKHPRPRRNYQRRAGRDNPGG